MVDKERLEDLVYRLRSADRRSLPLWSFDLLPLTRHDVRPATFAARMKRLAIAGLVLVLQSSATFAQTAPARASPGPHSVVSLDSPHSEPMHFLWIAAKQQVCSLACSQAGMMPVISGLYRRNKNPFYVCRTDLHEGKQAGYNLLPVWGDRCWVGYDGREVASDDYERLCGRVAEVRAP